MTATPRRTSPVRLVGVAGLVALVAGTTWQLDRLLLARREAQRPRPNPEVFPPGYSRLLRTLNPQDGSDVPWSARTLAPGTPVPDLALPAVADESTVRLERLRAGRPMVLAFGSFSCNLFCDRVPDLERLFRRYRATTAFAFVNVTEAGHDIAGLEFMLEGFALGGTLPLDVRRERIGRAMTATGLTIPALIDPEDAPAETAFDAFPLRLLAIDAHGRVAFDLGRGMTGSWDLDRLERWLQQPSEDTP